MNKIALIVIFPLLVSSIANASVVATWSEADATAATAWLNAIETSPSRTGAGVFFYSTTAGDPLFSDPFTANLTVWADRAELNIFGVGALPLQFTLAGVFPGLDPILLIQQEQLLATGADSYSYSSSFVVEEGFARVVAISAGLDGLWLRSDSGGGSPEVFTLRASAVPEASTVTFAVFTSTLLLRRRRNNKGEQDASGNRR